MPIDAQQCLHEFESMKANRSNWEHHWQEIANLVAPNRRFNGDVSAGVKMANRIFDTTAQVHAGRLASFLSGMLTNPSIVWFYLSSGNVEIDEDEEVAEWLWRTSRVMLDIFNSPKVGFYRAASEIYLDLVNFGTGVIHVRSSPGEPLTMKSIQLPNVYIDENADGVVDRLAIQFCYSARQAADEFGAANLPEKVRDALKDAKSADQKFTFIQLVTPRRDRVYGRADRRNMAWGSYVICTDPVEMVSESGFRTFPFVCPRWLKQSGEVWGRGPSMDVLPSIKVCNAMSKTMLVASEKMADPPLMMPDDGFLAPLSTHPGGINYYRSGSRDRVEPMYTGANFNVSLNELTRHQEAVKMGYFADLFSLPQQDRMTATEIMQRQRDQMQLLNPIVGRLTTEFLAPLINRVYEYAARSRMLAPAPQALRNGTITVEYRSPLAQAQKASESANFSQFLSLLAPLVEADPVLMQHVDGDKAVAWARNSYNLPPIFRRKADVQEMRDQQAQAAAAQQQAEIAATGAGAVKDVSLASEPLQALTQGI